MVDHRLQYKSVKMTVVLAVANSLAVHHCKFIISQLDVGVRVQTRLLAIL